MLSIDEIKAMVNLAATQDDLLKALEKAYFNTEHKDDAICDLAYQLRHKREQLLHVLRSVARDVESTIARLQVKDLSYGGNLNSLGILQGRGPEVDVKTALYCDAVERLKNELVRRRDAADKVAYQEALANMEPPRRRVFSAIEDGRTTVSKISRYLKIEFSSIAEHVQDLSLQGFIYWDGKNARPREHYRWADRQRELKAEANKVETEA